MIITNCQDMHLVLAVLRWLEENIQEVFLSKPAVRVALIILETLGAESRNNQAWAARLDKFILHLTKPEVRREISYHDYSILKLHFEDLIVTAALHPTGYLLAKLVVSMLELITEATRQEMRNCLARSVDLIRTSKTGIAVLKALE